MENLFLKLLNMSLSASWLVLAVLMLRLLLKKAPKWVRGVLWALVALRLVCPFSIESTLSLIPSAEPVPQEIVYAAHPRLNTGIPALNAATAPVMESAFAPTPEESANPLQIWTFIGARLWLAGVSTMLLYALVSYLRLRRRVDVSIPLQNDIWLCDGIDAPFILGVFRPRVYMPSSLAEPQLSHVLAHERAHLARHDHWWKPLGFALLAVYWFNPALWLAYILLCKDIELACDERVYRDMAIAERADYSQTLLDQSRPGSGVAACPLAFGEVGVKERVKAALSYKKPAFWVLAVSAAACVVVAVCFLTNPAKLALDFSRDEINEAETYHITTVEDLGLRQLSGEELDILYERLQGIPNAARKGDYAGLTPMYTLTFNVPYKGSFQLRGYNDEGTMTELYHEDWARHKGETWVIKDDDFGRYVMELCKYGGGQTSRSEEPIRTQEALRRLTLDDVRALAKKGTALSARDFDGYAYYETGSGLYIKAYPIDEVFAVLLGFASDADEPLYFKLTAKNDDGIFSDNVDMDSGDVESFIAMHSADKNGQEKPRLTLDNARVLAKRGEALTWEDLEGYEYYVTGSGLHSHLYPIDGRFSLTASGTLSSLRSAVLYDATAEESVDIRNPMDLNAFLDSHEKAQSVTFTAVLGFGGHYIDLEIAPGFYQRRYIIRTGNNERGLLAESFGFTIDDHSVDLDGDGVTELICNCVYGGDGAKRVYAYRWNGDWIERGYINYDKLNLNAWDDWGVNSTAEWFDPASGAIMVEYASLASSSGDSTSSGTFICETGFDAFDWEHYTRIE